MWLQSFLYLKVGQAQAAERVKLQRGKRAGNGIDEGRQEYTKRLAEERAADYRRSSRGGSKLITDPLMGAE